MLFQKEERKARLYGMADIFNANKNIFVIICVIFCIFSFEEKFRYYEFIGVISMYL